MESNTGVLFGSSQRDAQFSPIKKKTTWREEDAHTLRLSTAGVGLMSCEKSQRCEINLVPSPQTLTFYAL